MRLLHRHSFYHCFHTTNPPPVSWQDYGDSMTTPDAPRNRLICTEITSDSARGSIMRSNPVAMNMQLCIISDFCSRFIGHWLSCLTRLKLLMFRAVGLLSQQTVTYSNSLFLPASLDWFTWPTLAQRTSFFYSVFASNSVFLFHGFQGRCFFLPRLCEDSCSLLDFDIEFPTTCKKKGEGNSR